MARRQQEADITRVIEDWNEVTGQRRRVANKATRHMVRCRLKEGWTVEDFRLIHRWVRDTWTTDDFYSKYIQPSTVYRPLHFENYLVKARGHYSEREKKQEQTRREREKLRHWDSFRIPATMHSYVNGLTQEQRDRWIGRLPEGLRPYATGQRCDIEGFVEVIKEEKWKEEAKKAARREER